MLDADGATDYNEIEKIYELAVERSKQQGNDLACAIGCRNTAEKEV